MALAVNIYDELAELRRDRDALGAQYESLIQRVSALEAATAHKLFIGAVSYFYPGPKWDGLLSEKPRLVVINPANGPGAAINAAYAAQVGRAKAAGSAVYGYVHTKYGARPAAEVKLDIDRHVNWYGVQGIFVDTVSVDPVLLPYYADIAGHARGRGCTVAFNPGTRCLEQHAQMADYVMCSESDAATYRARTAAPWEALYAARMWHVVHSCPAADMPAVVALARTRAVGLLWVTDDVMPNPYDTLPSYFTAFGAAVRS